MDEKILNIIFEAMEEINEQLPPEQQLELTEETILYGRSGNLDSFGLVSLIVSVEERIFDEFGKQISIADEKAMSQTRSPFRTVGSLAQYIASLLQE